MDPSRSVKYFDLAFCILAYLQKEPWYTSMVVWPEELSFSYAMKRGGPKQGTEGGCSWSALASFRGQIDRTAVARMPGRHWTHLLTNEGPCLVYWGNLSTSWTYRKGINLKFSWIGAWFCKEFKGVTGSRSLYSKWHILY